MSTRRRFKRTAAKKQPEWFPKLIAQMERHGVNTHPPNSGARADPPREPHMTSAAYGAIVDALMLRDRKYFESHPDEEEFIRPVEPGDAPEHVGFDPSQQWFVKVTNIAEGVRTRYVFSVPWETSQQNPDRN